MVLFTLFEGVVSGVEEEGELSVGLFDNREDFRSPPKINIVGRCLQSLVAVVGRWLQRVVGVIPLRFGLAEFVFSWVSLISYYD